MRRGGRRGFRVVGRREQPSDGAALPLAGCLADHRADHEPHHVVQETVGFDLERQPASLGRSCQRAACTTHRWSSLLGAVPCDGERAEGMLAHHRIRRPVQRLAIERSRDYPFPPRAEWRVRRIVGPDAIAVSPRHGAVARVKVRHAFRTRRPPTRRPGGARSAHGAADPASTSPAPCTHGLAARVHARVGPPRAR